MARPWAEAREAEQRDGAEAVVDISNRTATRVPGVGRLGKSTIVAGAGVLLAALVGVLSPDTALWILLGSVAVAIALVRPWWVLCLVPPAITLDTVVELHVGPLRAGPTDVLIGALVLGWAARTLAPVAYGERAWPPRGHFPRWWSDPAARAVACSLGAYLVVIVLSIAVARDHSAALKEVLKWAEVLVLFAVAADALREPGQRRAVVWVVIGTGVAEALIGYVQWVIAAGDLGAGGASLRVFGTFSQPNPFAAFLNLALPLAIALALLGQRASERWIAAAAAVLLLGAQALAASRGGLIGLAAAVVIMTVLAVGLLRQALVAGIVVGVFGGAAWAFGIVPASLRGRLLHVLRLDNVSLTGPVNDANFSSVERLAHWAAGVRMFAAHPLLGVGAGNYAAAYPRYKVPDWNQALGQAHNYFINAAAETGVLGLLAVIALVVSALWLVWRAEAVARASDGPTPRTRLGLVAVRAGGSERWVAVGASGVVAAVVVHSMVDDLFVHGMELQFALVLAVAAGLVVMGRAVPSGA